MKVRHICFVHPAFYKPNTAIGVQATPEGISAMIRNTGLRSGAEVAQMFLRFPSEAGEPPQQLKGFSKTPVLAPGATTTVYFPLRSRDVSVWDVGVHGWRRQQGVFGVRVGASSRDIRLFGKFTV